MAFTDEAATTSSSLAPYCVDPKSRLGLCSDWFGRREVVQSVAPGLPTDEVLDYARRGSGPLVVALTAATGIAEEMFFRGELYDALPQRHATVGATWRGRFA